MLRMTCFLLVLITGWPGSVLAQEPPAGLSPAQRGEWFVLNKPFVNVDFDQETFDALWQVWPESLQEKARNATAKQRRKMAYSRYGLTDRPDDSSGKPMQYVVTKNGNWVMNCHSCHSGNVAGKLILGAPNTHYAMQTLLEETRTIKPKLGKRLTSKEISSVLFPLGGNVGTTNAVMFGVALATFRDKDMNVVSNYTIPRFVHHDMDAPAWWHFKKKNRLYIDGFAEKHHRILMSFALVRSNDAKKYRGFEDDFKDIYAYLESFRPPAYPFEIDKQLALQGESIFNDHCSRCHGKYGEQESYPNQIVPIEEIGTDPVRLKALPVSYRQELGKSWTGEYGQLNTVSNPKGYLAPPLDGAWASAPYFHNGSVPTLWHVLHPEERPVIWQRTEDGYDQKRIGLEIKTFEKMPREVKAPAEKRTYFNTKRFGKKRTGHNYPNDLNESEKRAVLEYLKSL